MISGRTDKTKIAEAFWRDCSLRANFARKQATYHIPCWSGAKMQHVLGKVKRRNDGLWEWWRFKKPTEFFVHGDWNGSSSVYAQGACSTIEEAKQQVEAGWLSK